MPNMNIFVKVIKEYFPSLKSHCLQKKKGVKVHGCITERVWLQKKAQVQPAQGNGRVSVWQRMRKEQPHYEDMLLNTLRVPHQGCHITGVTLGKLYTSGKPPKPSIQCSKLQFQSGVDSTGTNESQASNRSFRFYNEGSQWQRRNEERTAPEKIKV